VAGGLIAWLFSTLWAVVTYGGFELRLIGDRLHASFGLLERRRVTIPRSRIQAVTISEGLFRQPFGLASIRAESAGFGKDQGESGVLMPIIKRGEIPALLAVACPRYAATPHDPAATWRTPPQRSLRRYALSPVWTAAFLSAVALAVTILVPRIDWQWGLLSLLSLPVALAVGISQFRATGWRFEGDGMLIVRRRPLDLVTTITRPNRLQIRQLSANPLQRRAKLGTFAAAVASGGSGGGFAIEHVDWDDGIGLLERLAPESRTPGTLAPLDKPSTAP
jgi:putative membrane protein